MRTIQLHRYKIRCTLISYFSKPLSLAWGGGFDKKYAVFFFSRNGNPYRYTKSNSTKYHLILPGETNKSSTYVKAKKTRPHSVSKLYLSLLAINAQYRGDRQGKKTTQRMKKCKWKYGKYENMDSRLVLQNRTHHYIYYYLLKHIY